LEQSSSFYCEPPVGAHAQVWDDAVTDGCEPDCRMATTLIEVRVALPDPGKLKILPRDLGAAFFGETRSPFSSFWLHPARPHNGIPGCSDLIRFTPDKPCKRTTQVCARAGSTERALATYDSMRAAPPGSRMAPSVHAYTAAMRAAAEGGRWQRALDIWDDMARAGCRPTGAHLEALV